LAVIQSPTPWDVILDLMEGGSKIFLRNERGISPHDLLPPILRLQKELVADCWLGLVLEDAAHILEQSEQGKKSFPTKKTSSPKIIRLNRIKLRISLHKDINNTERFSTSSSHVQHYCLKHSLQSTYL